MTRFLVVGGGVVGRRVLRLLAGDVAAVVTGHPRPDRAAELFPAEDDATPEPSPDTVVVIATGAPHAPLVADLAAFGVSVVSVSDDLGDVRELLELHDAFTAAGASLVVGAAMSPGLSGLLARLLCRQLGRCDEIHVAAHATAGPACARQHHQSLAGHAIGWHDHQWVQRAAGSGRELCWFPEPVGAHDCYRAELADPLLLHQSFPDAARISARLSATRRDRLTARLPMLRPPHPEGGVGALRVEVRGTDVNGARAVQIAGIAEFVGAATAATAAAMAEAASAGQLPTGVVLTGDERLDLMALLAAVTRHGVRLQEFTGVPQRG
jgi:hypothetical protein